MSFNLKILGCNSATPTAWANPSSQFLNMEERYFLIDCGEGTQVELRRHKIKFSRINNIFISHLHGDHIFGLIGLISTFHMLDRKSQLNIYSPRGLKDLIVTQLRITQTRLSYFVNFIELTNKEDEIVFEDDKVEVSSFPLKHRITCYGFLFREKPKERKLEIADVEKYNIDKSLYRSIKKGNDVVNEDGILIENRLITSDPPKTLSYAYCTDTVYYEKIIPSIKGVDLLYHESTFLEDKKALAKKTGHSTALDAAKIATLANVNKLVLGHFSARYKDRSVYLNEALKEFPNTEIAEDGKDFILTN